MKKNLYLLAFLFITGLTASATVPEKKGWWKFDEGDVLKATIGSDLTVSGSVSGVDGPSMDNKAIQVGLGSYLIMNHGLNPNGGGSMVNEYSILIDFSVPETNIWHAFFQTDPTNSDDADLFTSSSSNAIGTAATNYSSKGVAQDTWYRMVISVYNGNFFKVYINGDLWLDGNAQDIDGRFALSNPLLIFADNDGDDGTINCSELAIWDVALSDEQIIELGDVNGARIRTREKIGSWKFDDPANLLAADIGSPLQLVGTQESVDGPSASNMATRIGVGSFLKMAPGIALSGTDTLVNEYSLQIDFSIPAAGIWHAFFQTDPTNISDADLFTNTSNAIGTAATKYSSSTISANTWYRMVVSVKNGEFFRVYMNGQLWLEGDPQAIDGRFGLADTLLMFADNDGDDGEIICSEINLWEVALTTDEVAGLGDDPTNKIPDRVGWWKFDDPSNLLKATIGSDLTLTGDQTATDGPTASNKATNLGLGNYLSMDPGIGANGEGNLTNEYTLQIDFSIPEAGTWHAFFQTDPTNSDDADLFTNTTNHIGTQATTYTVNSIEANTWYRMIVSVKNGAFFRIYINGETWLDGAGQATDGRFALAEALLIFADNDGDDGSINCAELGIWDRALGPDQVVKLGGVDLSTGIDKHGKISDGSTLGQNFPNPFINSTTFPYSVSKSGNVSFMIYDITGKEVKRVNEGNRMPGNYELKITSDQLAQGVYYVQMNTGSTSATRKMIVIR